MGFPSEGGMKMRYSLVGVDGNAFAIMGYTSRVLKEVGRRGLIEKMRTEAMSGDYNHLICVCMEYIDMANELVEEREEYWSDFEEEDWYEDLNDREFDIPYEEV